MEPKWQALMSLMKWVTRHKGVAGAVGSLAMAITFLALLLWPLTPPGAFSRRPRARQAQEDDRAPQPDAPQARTPRASYRLYAETTSGIPLSVGLRSWSGPTVYTDCSGEAVIDARWLQGPVRVLGRDGSVLLTVTLVPDDNGTVRVTIPDEHFRRTGFSSNGRSAP